LSTSAANGENSAGHHSRLAEWAPWIVAISVMLATFMEVLDTSIASVALPHIAGSLSATNSEATWVLTSYLVANAIFLPASNWFSLRFGRKRFLLTCVTIFTVASIFCGSANSLGLLLFARLVQGAGGGALQPLAQAIMLESFPPKKRPAAMAFYAFGIVVAPVLGPTLGGWLTDNYSWRYAFYINIPVGLLAVMMIGRFVKDPHYIRDTKAGPFDNIGLGLLALWTGSLQIILDKGQEADWFSANWICVGFVIMVVSFAAWVWHSWTSPNPLVNLRVLKDWNFAIGCLLITLLGLALYTTLTMLPLYYQEVMGYTALSAGLVVGPRGIGSMLGMPVIGFLGSRIDSRILMTFGFVCFAVCSLIFGAVNLSLGPYTMILPIVISGFAMTFVFVPISTQAYSNMRNQAIGNATGIFNLLRNLGGSVGIAISQTMLERRALFHQVQIVASAPQTSYWLQQRVNNLQIFLAPAIGKGNARAGAYGEIYMMILQQARLKAFVDIFQWTALIAFLCAALVWLFHKVDPHKPPTASAH